MDLYDKLKERIDNCEDIYFSEESKDIIEVKCSGMHFTIDYVNDSVTFPYWFRYITATFAEKPFYDLWIYACAAIKEKEQSILKEIL